MPSQKAHTKKRLNPLQFQAINSNSTVQLNTIPIPLPIKVLYNIMQ